MRNIYQIERNTRSGRKATYLQKLSAMQIEVLQAKGASVRLIGERLVA